MINPKPCGTIKIDTKCKNCGHELSYKSSTDGILEAMGIEPVRWMCYRSLRLDIKGGCGTAYTVSEITTIVMFEDQNIIQKSIRKIRLLLGV